MNLAQPARRGHDCVASPMNEFPRCAKCKGRTDWELVCKHQVPTESADSTSTSTRTRALLGFAASCGANRRYRSYRRGLVQNPSACMCSNEESIRKIKAALPRELRSKQCTLMKTMRATMSLQQDAVERRCRIECACNEGCASRVPKATAKVHDVIAS
eukprot:4573471-Pleurochrysis_carterae.AAC.3